MSVHVKWHPPATRIATGSPIRARNGGISQWGAIGTTITPVEVEWRGVKWRVAWDAEAKTLWVMTPNEAEIAKECHAMHLSQLAQLYAKGKDVPRAGNGALTPEQVSAQGLEAEQIAEHVRQRRAALELVSNAAKRAFELGASPADVREAVLAAMGLDAALRD